MGVIESFVKAIEAGQKNLGIPVSKANLMNALVRHIDLVNAMDEAAKRPYKALEDLLDLKQKQANVSEARTARISGNTITVFTIVTIIFLPASFMTAFLALPIAEFSKSNSNFELAYAIKYIMIITAALAVPFVILALYVNPLLRFFKAFVGSFRKISERWSSSTVVRPILKRVPALAMVFIWTPILFIYCIILLGYAACSFLFNWKRLFRWFKEHRQTKKTPKADGTEGSKRRFVVGKIIASIAQHRAEKARNAEEHADGAELGGAPVQSVEPDIPS